MTGTPTVVQMVLSLIAVVGVILALAWMTRRLQGLRAGTPGALKVKATLAVGMKERVVLIEAAGRQFLIGVAPGQVRLIEALGMAPEEVALPPVEHGADGSNPPSAAGARPSFREAFAHQLGQLIGR